MKTLAHLSLSGPSGPPALDPVEEVLAPREGTVSTRRALSRTMTVWSSWRYLKPAMRTSVPSTPSGQSGLPALRSVEIH